MQKLKVYTAATPVSRSNSRRLHLCQPPDRFYAPACLAAALRTGKKSTTFSRSSRKSTRPMASTLSTTVRTSSVSEPKRSTAKGPDPPAVPATCIDVHSHRLPTVVSLNKNEQKEDCEWRALGRSHPHAALTLRTSLLARARSSPGFLKINPNGRIPALLDPNNGDFCVFETAAILLYLEKKVCAGCAPSGCRALPQPCPHFAHTYQTQPPLQYDPKHLFSWPSTDPQADNYRSQVLQWIFCEH